MSVIKCGCREPAASMSLLFTPGCGSHCLLDRVCLRNAIHCVCHTLWLQGACCLRGSCTECCLQSAPSPERWMSSMSPCCHKFAPTCVCAAFPAGCREPAASEGHAVRCCPHSAPSRARWMCPMAAPPPSPPAAGTSRTRQVSTQFQGAARHVS